MYEVTKDRYWNLTREHKTACNCFVRVKSTRIILMKLFFYNSMHVLYMFLYLAGINGQNQVNHCIWACNNSHLNAWYTHVSKKRLLDLVCSIFIAYVDKFSERPIVKTFRNDALTLISWNSCGICTVISTFQFNLESSRVDGLFHPSSKSSWGKWSVRYEISALQCTSARMIVNYLLKSETAEGREIMECKR